MRTGDYHAACQERGGAPWNCRNSTICGKSFCTIERALLGASLPGEYPALFFYCKAFSWRTSVSWQLLPEPGEFTLDLPSPDYPYLPEARHFFLDVAAPLRFETTSCAPMRLRRGIWL